MKRLILTFHGIGPKPRQLSPEESNVWVDESQLTSVLDLLADHPSVGITFDDGNRSDVDIALPELRRRGLSAEFFVLAGKFGLPGYLDRDGVLELQREGMAIGSHGMHHRSWRKLSAADAHEELVTSRTVLSELTGRPVLSAACPFGAYDRRALSAVRRAGYQRVYTSDGGPARDTWLQPRNTIKRDQSVSELVALLAGSRPVSSSALSALKRTAKRWR